MSRPGPGRLPAGGTLIPKASLWRDVPSSVPEAKEREALDRLRMLRVAKDLFTSEWYHRSSAQLQLSDRATAALERVAGESREEREDILDLIGRWTRRLDEPAFDDGPDRVAHAARRDFLLHLIDAKESSGEVLERAALLAPLALREDFERLAAVDFRHAVELRQLLVDEVQTEWRERTRGGG